MKITLRKGASLLLALTLFMSLTIQAMADTIDSQISIVKAVTADKTVSAFNIKIENLPLQNYLAFRLELEVNPAVVKLPTVYKNLGDTAVKEVAGIYTRSNDLANLNGWYFTTALTSNKDIVLMGYLKEGNAKPINTATLDLGRLTFDNVAKDGNTAEAVKILDARFYKDTGVSENAEDIIKITNTKAVSTIIPIVSDSYVGPFKNDVVKNTDFVQELNDAYLSSKTAESKLKDVENNKFKDSIKTMNGVGIVSGYPDGNFYPDNEISRAELATLLVKTFQLTGTSEEISADTTDHWARESISVLRGNKVMNGYPDGSFKPDASITRAEAVTLVKGLLNENLVVANPKPFSDTGNSWANPSIYYLFSLGVISGRTDTTFEPDSPITRAESADMLLKVLKLHSNIKLN